MKMLARLTQTGLIILLALAALPMHAVLASNDKATDTTTLSESPKLTSQKVFFLGLSGGFPQLAGLRGDLVPAKSRDQRPSFLFTVEGGVTLGFYLNVTAESRLGSSPFYAGVGYNYNKIILSGSAGDMAWAGETNLHALLLLTSYRSSYLKPAAWCISLGAMISPDLNDVPVLPLLKVSLARTD